MKRRLFLQFPLLAAPLALQAQSIQVDRSKKGFKVEAGKDRFNNPLRPYLYLKVSGKDTGGDLCIFESVSNDLKGGPPMHVHHHQDEWWYVMEGEMLVKVGDDTFHLKPGDSLFAPRGIPHSPAISNEGKSKILTLFQPAGSMEDFFDKLGKFTTFPPPMEEFKKLFHEHGMEIVGPRLKID